MLIGGVGLTVRTVPRVRRCLADKSVYVDATRGSIELSLGPTVGARLGSDPKTCSGSSRCDFVECQTLGVGWSNDHAWLGPMVVINA